MGEDSLVAAGIGIPLRKAHPVKTAVGFPDRFRIGTDLHRFLVDRRTIGDEPDLVAFGIIVRHDANAHVGRKLLERCLPIFLRHPFRSMGKDGRARRQVELHEIPLILPAENEDGLRILSVALQVEVDLVARTIAGEVRLPAGNPSRTRPAAAHQARLEPGASAADPAILIPDFHGPFVTRAGFEGLSTIHYAHGNVGDAAVRVIDQRALARFLDGNPVGFLPLVVFRADHFPAEARRFHVDAQRSFHIFYLKVRYAEDSLRLPLAGKQHQYGRHCRQKSFHRCMSFRYKLSAIRWTCSITRRKLPPAICRIS